jgi:hypothetical protein
MYQDPTVGERVLADGHAHDVSDWPSVYQFRRSRDESVANSAAQAVVASRDYRSPPVLSLAGHYRS